MTPGAASLSKAPDPMLNHENRVMLLVMMLPRGSHEIPESQAQWAVRVQGIKVSHGFIGIALRGPKLGLSL